VKVVASLVQLTQVLHKS